ncbi:OmpH family outer membrane protein [Hymenobacter rubripertinctus]|uniref:OmpH family outer membrane protein n=1 Tax=Hymenobacter rubripertinctus TaxID=2029981 RepID=A0A418QKM3_9BACT|nr:OmpH family outer membrane protein [Hymenobacter rubripertinctus]RIY05629.1 OmpH family outer membrane protein [Hymenobacter rubripertinctus]
MKNSLQLIVNAVLAIAVAVLFYLYFAGQPAKAVRPPVAVVATATDSAATDAPEAEEPEAEESSLSALADTNKVGYVESGKLLDGYQGMKDARKRLETKARGWEAQNKKLVTGFQAAVQQYQQKAESMTQEQRATTEQQLQARQMQVAQEQEKLQRQAQEEEAKTTQQALERANKQIERYGKQHGYRLILLSGGGGIGYARKDLDVTTPVLRFLNDEYRGKK